jgi:hypothetical protein
MIQKKNETRLLLTRATAGDIFTFNGHRYQVVGVSRYRTEAGRARLLVTLAATCEVCGESYQVTTGRAPVWIPRTCPPHRGRGLRRAPGAGATLAQDVPVDPGQGQTVAAAEMDTGGLPDGFKHCTRCGRVLPVGDFYRHRYRTDGLDGMCKTCRKERTTTARREKRGRGLCVDCGRESGGARYCLDCLDKRRDHKNGIAVKPVQTTRRCSSCGEVKPVVEFYRRAWGPASTCKACEIKNQAERSAHWRRLGLCGRCGGPVADGTATCPRCLDRRRRRESGSGSESNGGSDQARRTYELTVDESANTDRQGD